MVGFKGSSLTLATTSIETLKADLSQRNLGGVIIGLGGSQTTQNPTQILLLTSQLQSTSVIPLFIATDQEGGLVARLGSNNGFSTTPTAYRIGTVVGTEDTIRSTARLMAGWLQQMKININFAPVVDVNVNPASPAIGAKERSFSKFPATVAKDAEWFIDEFHKKGIMSTLKHFPGHGSAVGDTHFLLTDITKTWADSELVPYATLIPKQLPDLIMTGHLYNATIDTSYPATLSKKTIDGILRTTLGYTGVIVSDELFMSSIRNYYSFETAIELAINAGVDILLYSTNLMLTPDSSSLVRKAIDAIEAKVLAGVIPRSRIDESYNRIMALKSKYLGVIGVPIARAEIPASVHLGVYPNPFNSSTTLRIELQLDQYVRLRIYDMLGRQVDVLLEDRLPAGAYNVRWDASRFPSGTYIAVLHTPTKVVTQKIILLK